MVAGLTLYKVQMNIYLLDFHKREGDQFTFMVSQTTAVRMVNEPCRLCWLFFTIISLFVVSLVLGVRIF